MVPGFEYDIFISYRHKDNLGDHWVTEFVSALKTELEPTFKENISVYFDTNAHDGLSDNHDVDLSLREKIKSLILIPIISQTYCDPKSFAWKNEFLPFQELASKDPFGLKLKVANGNIASRVLPVRIHELGDLDLGILEKELGGKLRAIDFMFKSPGISRPLVRSDKQIDNAHKIFYRDQINKVANAVKEIIDALKTDKHHIDQNTTERFLGVNNTLPIPATTLYGRDHELAEIAELLNKNRIVSIIGSGGMGKTRLALELSHRLKDGYSGNVIFVPLASLTASEDVIPTLANVLGIKEAEGRTLIKGVSSIVGDHKALFVLDNLEQVIAVAPQVAELVSNCPNLKILTTSRTPLKIRAEREYALKPLLLPSNQNLKSIDLLMEFPSVSLFVDRAQKVNAGFRLTDENANEVVQICRRLDGLPLALELAAARLRMMSIKQLLQRLEHALDILTSGAKDLPERHQTLRATIDWSHSLLTESEKNLFRRMAVFNGGCTIEAIEETCYEQSSFVAFDELESLVDKGLVQRVESSDRFMMLQTIKEYAVERLDTMAETNKIKLRQARHFLKVATEIREGVENKNQLEAMQQGILEEDNLQSVLEFLLSEATDGNAEAAEIGLTICGQLYFFWHIRCKHIMARHYSNSFLALPNCPPFSRGKYLCLNAVGLASSTLGRHEQSIKEHRAAYDIAISFNDKSTMLVSDLSMFIANLGIGKIEEAEKCAKECLELGLAIGTDFELGFAYTAAGIMHTVKGEFDAAKISFDKALLIQERIPDLEGGGLSKGGLALLSSILGKYDESIELYKASLKSFTTIGDRAEEARILEEMAWVFLKIKNVKEARKYFLNSIHAYEDVGSVRGIGLALLGIAGVESVEQHPSKAIEIATAAQLFTQQEGVVNNYGEGFQGKVYLDDAKDKLSKEEFEKAIESGKKLSLKDTLQFASLS